MFMPFGHGVCASLAQSSPYGPTAWVAGAHSFFGTSPEGARQTRYLAPSGLDIRLIGLRTLSAAQGFAGPPFRGLRRGFETTSSLFYELSKLLPQSLDSACELVRQLPHLPGAVHVRCGGEHAITVIIPRATR